MFLALPISDHIGTGYRTDSRSSPGPGTVGTGAVCLEPQPQSYMLARPLHLADLSTVAAGSSVTSSAVAHSPVSVPVRLFVAFASCYAVGTPR